MIEVEVDGGTGIVAKANGDKVVGKEESGPNGAAAIACFKCGVVGGS